VLADARAAGAEGFVLGGDYVLLGAYPRETVDALRRLDAALGITWIRGNTDRWLVDASDVPESELNERALAYCRAALGETAGELASLPATADLDGVLFCHASPRSDMASFMPSAGEVDATLLADDDPDVIAFGHTHLQFRRPLGRHTLVNPGSVGMPFDGDRRAAYALWHGASDFELRRVTYDSERYARDLADRLGGALGDAVETVVRRIEEASFAR
jgi:diadenosine tetraphosphatase ApaH/serine/threonine PP2A family protein phosphatase